MAPYLSVATVQRQAAVVLEDRVSRGRDAAHSVGAEEGQILTELRRTDTCRAREFFAGYDVRPVVAQLAQFSTLSGIEQLNANFGDLLQLQQITQGANLVGRSVTYNRADGKGQQAGTVDSVGVVNGKIQLSIGGTSVGLDQVANIRPQ